MITPRYALPQTTRTSRSRTSASAFVEELVDTLPAFRDTVLYDGRTLVLQRRAQNLAADLACVYGGREGGGRFAFPDVDQLAGDSGAWRGVAWRGVAWCGAAWRGRSPGVGLGVRLGLFVPIQKGVVMGHRDRGAG